MHVAIMLYAGFRLLEVTGPMEVFHEANRLCGGTLYQQHLVGPSPGPILCSNGVAVGTTESLSNAHASFDIVMVPGTPDIAAGLAHRELVDWLRDTGRKVRRLASMSSGAFLVARAGLADYRAVAAHGRDAQRLSSEHPLVRVISDQRCLKDGDLYSSRSVGDAMQVALAMVAEDLGEKFAKRIAQSLSNRAVSWTRI